MHLDRESSAASRQGELPSSDTQQQFKRRTVGRVTDAPGLLHAGENTPLTEIFHSELSKKV